MTTPEAIHNRLAQYVASLELRHNQSAEMRPHYEIAILCADDGVQTAFRGTCPVCGGTSWLPAGSWGGFPMRERFKEVRTAMEKSAHE